MAEEIRWTYDLSHRSEHSTKNIAAYRIVRTYRDGKLLTPFEQVERIEGGENFAQAIEAADAIRELTPDGPQLLACFNYAVVHPEYGCGCIGGPF